MKKAGLAVGANSDGTVRASSRFGIRPTGHMNRRLQFLRAELMPSLREQDFNGGANTWLSGCASDEWQKTKRNGQ